MGVFIVAELGSNHNGNLNLAFSMITQAKRAGCDAVKFQHYRPERIAANDSSLYWQGPERSQREAFAANRLSATEMAEAFTYARSIGIEPFSTPFDLEAVDELERLGVRRFKIASGDITNVELLRAVAGKRLPTMLSTGASTLSEVADAVEEIELVWPTADLTLMACTLCYPTRIEDANLRQLESLRSLGYKVGLSDHTESLLVPALAVALGSVVLEKHFTSDRQMSGSPDHVMSMDPRMMETLVLNVREAEQALGSGEKVVLPCEVTARVGARRSLAAVTDIRAGESVLPEMLIALRPGTGMPPRMALRIIGRKVTRDIIAGSLICEEDLA